jgi:hypothetical protein
MTVLRSLGREQRGVSLQQKEPFDVEGLSNLGVFGLTPQSVALAAVRIQEETGRFYGGLDDEGVREKAADPIDRIDGQEAIFFNLPVCDIDTVELLERQERICDADRFADDFEMCRFNLLMNCACSNLRLGDQDWPFQKGDDVNCNIEQPGGS